MTSTYKMLDMMLDVKNKSHSPELEEIADLLEKPQLQPNHNMGQNLAAILKSHTPNHSPMD